MLGFASSNVPRIEGVKKGIQYKGKEGKVG
jgi:hypothetical protein